MKYTRSQDGKERATIVVRWRVTREEYAALQRFAREYTSAGMTVRDYLWSCLFDGVFANQDSQRREEEA